MSDASDKLARSRQAILEYMARRERRHDPREETPAGFAAMGGYPDDGESPDPGSGWLGHLSHVVRTWWRHHPASMAVELADPVMRGYARRKPGQLVAISVAAGAALMLTRPWRVISLTTLLVALLKSSQLSNLIMAAMSAADYRKDNDRP